MRHATLHQLKIFERVAQHLSFTRAAEELYLTQPTISIQIKQLIQIVGLPLFDHIGKRIFLTDAGKELLKVCHTMFEDLSRFEMLIADMQGVKTGKLRLGVITTAQYFIPRLLGLFCDKFPGIEISIRVINRERMLQHIVDNEDDLYILGQPSENMDVCVKPFLINPLVVVASSQHPLAHLAHVSATQLAQEPFLMREWGSGTRLATEAYFNERGLALNIRMELGSNEAIKQAIAGGLGIAVLSAHTLSLEKSGNELTVLQADDFPIMRQWHVAYSKGKQLSVVAEAFLAFLLQKSHSVAQQYLKSLPGFENDSAHK